MARRHIFPILGLALTLILPAIAKAAGKQCDFQPDIVALTDYVLKNRAGLQRFKGLRYGTISAYLKLRYGKLADKDAEAMLMPLVAARVSRADELMFAWAINSVGVDAAIAIVGPKATKLLLAQGYSSSVLRAAIVKEGISALAEQLNGATPEERFRVEVKVPTALLDKFDTYKNELGREAETGGMVQMAAGLAAMQTDRKAWGDFVARVKDKEALQRAVSFWHWAPALVGNPELERLNLDPKWQKNREQLHQAMVASALMPERDFLLTYVNQSGKTEDVAKVAETIETVAADKTGEPWTMDRAWITAYLELLTVSADPATVDGMLKSIPFGGLRHYDGSVRDVLDWMMAADALKAYVLKQSDVDAKPDLVSEDFASDWGSWQTAADVIRAGGDPGLLRASPKMLAIASELMFAAGKPHQLASLIIGARPDDETVGLAEDFANRMDRVCYGYLNFPAEGLTIPDTPIFRFD